MSCLNVFDVPEMMRGAQPRASPSERSDFEQRCVKLYDEAVEEEAYGTRHAHAAADDMVTADALAIMFPSIDVSLVRSLVAEARNQQDAIDTLLALSVTAHTQEEQSKALVPPFRDLGTNDMSLFPSLTDASGWQLPSRRGFELNTEADDGTEWRDRAKNAAEIPAVVCGRPKPLMPASNKKTIQEKMHDSQGADIAPGLDAYEFRQQQGQRRVRNRAQYGRRRGLRDTGCSKTTREVKDVVDHQPPEDDQLEYDCSLSSGAL